MAPIPLASAMTRATRTCYSNCSPTDLRALASLIVLAFLIAVVIVYFYELKKAKRLLKENSIPFSKFKIFGRALLAASIIGLVVFCAGERTGRSGRSKNPGVRGNNVAPQASSGAGLDPAMGEQMEMQGGLGPAMGQQMEMQGMTMNMNNMAGQSTSLAASDPVLG